MILEELTRLSSNLCNALSMISPLTFSSSSEPILRDDDDDPTEVRVHEDPEVKQAVQVLDKLISVAKQCHKALQPLVYRSDCNKVFPERSQDPLKNNNHQQTQLNVVPPSSSSSSSSYPRRRRSSEDVNRDGSVDEEEEEQQESTTTTTTQESEFEEQYEEFEDEDEDEFPTVGSSDGKKLEFSSDGFGRYDLTAGSFTQLQIRCSLMEDCSGIEATAAAELDHESLEGGGEFWSPSATLQELDIKSTAAGFFFQTGLRSLEAYEYKASVEEETELPYPSDLFFFEEILCKEMDHTTTTTTDGIPREVEPSLKWDQHEPLSTTITREQKKCGSPKSDLAAAVCSSCIGGSAMSSEKAGGGIRVLVEEVRKALKEYARESLKELDVHDICCARRKILEADGFKPLMEELVVDSFAEFPSPSSSTSNETAPSSEEFSEENHHHHHHQPIMPNAATEKKEIDCDFLQSSEKAVIDWDFLPSLEKVQTSLEPPDDAMNSSSSGSELLAHAPLDGGLEPTPKRSKTLELAIVSKDALEKPHDDDDMVLSELQNSRQVDPWEPCTEEDGAAAAATDGALRRDSEFLFPTRHFKHKVSVSSAEEEDKKETTTTTTTAARLVIIHSARVVPETTANSPHQKQQQQLAARSSGSRKKELQLAFLSSSRAPKGGLRKLTGGGGGAATSSSSKLVSRRSKRTVTFVVDDEEEAQMDDEEDGFFFPSLKSWEIQDDDELQRPAVDNNNNNNKPLGHKKPVLASKYYKQQAEARKPHQKPISASKPVSAASKHKLLQAEAADKSLFFVRETPVPQSHNRRTTSTSTKMRVYSDCFPASKTSISSDCFHASKTSVSVSSDCFPRSKTRVSSDCFPQSKTSVSSDCFPTSKTSVSSDCFPPSKTSVSSVCFPTSKTSVSSDCFPQSKTSVSSDCFPASKTSVSSDCFPQLKTGVSSDCFPPSKTSVSSDCFPPSKTSVSSDCFPSSKTGVMMQHMISRLGRIFSLLPFKGSGGGGGSNNKKGRFRIRPSNNSSLWATPKETSFGGSARTDAEQIKRILRASQKTFAELTTSDFLSQELD